MRKASTALPQAQAARRYKYGPARMIVFVHSCQTKRARRSRPGSVSTLSNATLRPTTKSKPSMPPGPAYNWLCVLHSTAEIISHAARYKAAQVAPNALASYANPRKRRRTDGPVDLREHESASTPAKEPQEHVKSTPAFVDTKHESKKQSHTEPVKPVEVDKKELVRSIIFPTYFLLQHSLFIYRAHLNRQ